MAQFFISIFLVCWILLRYTKQNAEVQTIQSSAFMGCNLAQLVRTLLAFQNIQVYFPAFECSLKTLCSTRGSETIFWSPWALHACDTCTHMQTKESQIQN